MRRLIPLLAAAGLTVAACGDQTARTTTDEPARNPDQHYTATALVLENPEHGPQLCLGGVDDSYPPQCGGPDISNWNWDDVEATSEGGTTWGDYSVVGTYDGTSFTLTEPPEPAGDGALSAEPGPVESSTPCEEPSGGWQVVDPDLATDAAMNSAIEYAYRQPDHAGIWMDQSINPALSGDSELSAEDIEGAANDPTKLILNFSFTGDIDRHEREIRAIWGGPLCVSVAERTEAELMDIQMALHNELPEILGSGIDSMTGTLYVDVILDDGTMQRSLDDRYGEGVVRVHSALEPVD
jgi:hypothetical protein